MKFKKLAAFAACGVLAASLGLAGCSGGASSSSSSNASSSSAATEATEAELLNDGELTIILSPDYPPFENIEDGELEGFEVDLGTAIAEQLDLNPNFVQMQFDTIIPAISAGGQGDIGMSGFSVDPDRAKEIDFTTSYYVDDLGIAVMQDSGITEENAADALDNAGMIIAVQTGTTGEAYAQENFPNATIQGYGNSTDCFAAMQSGQANAVCTNLAVVERMIETAYNDAEVVLTDATGEEYAAVVSQDNPELTKQVNDALKTLEDNGTIQQLMDKWF